VPSAKASITTYTVTLTGGTTGCTSGTGTLTINSGNTPTSNDTIELTTSTGCYVGGVGAAPVAGTTGTTDNFGPTGAGDCMTNCSDLSTLPASTDITFQGSDVGACSTSSKCTTSESTFNDQLQISSSGFFTTSSNDVLASSSNGGTNSPITVDFKDATLVTPEPSTLLLFGSGMLLVAGVFRKRLGLGRTA